jgi:hypothetical protein
VVDLESFRRVASALVCDRSLRCGWGFTGDSFCAPRFAALEATRLPTASPPAPFDLALARTCVDQLLEVEDCGAAFDVALDCYSLNGGAWAVDTQSRSWSTMGSTCTDACDFGLACVAGICARAARVTEACGAVPCESGLACRGGVCAFAELGEACDVTECAPGAACVGVDDGPGWFGGRVVGPPFICVAAACAPAYWSHHVGCACATNADCPADVAVCFAGTCTLRPFADEPCIPGGPLCFASTCTAGTCG